MTRPKTLIAALGRKIRRPPSNLVLLHVASVLAPWVLFVLGTKVHRYVSAVAEFEVGFSVVDLLGVLGPDLWVIFLYGLCWTLLLSLPPRYERWMGRQSDELLAASLRVRFGRWAKRHPIALLLHAGLILSFHLCTVALTLLTVSEHGYFVLQNLPGDGAMLMYALDNFEMLKPVLATKVTPGLIWGVSALGIFLFHPFALRLLKRARAHIGAEVAWKDFLLPGTRRRLALALCMWVLAGLGFSAFTVDEDVAVLQANGNWSILTEALAYGDETYGNLQDVDLGERLFLAETPRTQKHNVVLIVLESTRSRSLELYGSDHDTMPTLSKLAARGRWVREAYTTVPHTSKALVSIHCGAYPKLVQDIDEAQVGALPDACLAKLLSEHDYRTAFFQPAEEAFERRYSLVRNFGFSHFAGKESLPNTEGFHESSYFGFEDDIMLAPAMAWVDEHKGRPFFLSLLTLTAHHDYTVPRGFSTRDFVDDKELNGYLNTLAYTDRFLKKLVAQFEERGLMEHTLFIIVGDHGEGFGEHGRKEHDNVIYEEGLQVPLVLFGPGVPADGRPIEGLRQHIDILPTVADALGFDLLGGQLPGASVLSSPGHERLFFSCWYRGFCMALREGSEKTIYHYKKRRSQVFDLSDDGLELRDLSRSRGVDAAKIEALKHWKHDVNLRYAAHLAQQKTRFVTMQAPQPPHPAHILFEDDVAILGYGVSKSRVKAGETVEIATFFRALRATDRDWRLFVHVRGPGKFINADHTPVSGAYPIRDWKPGEYVEDRHVIHIARNSPPGRYTVMVGLWDKAVKGDQAARAKPVSEGHTVDAQRRVHLLHIEVIP